jgi:hypothetical protein
MRVLLKTYDLRFQVHHTITILTHIKIRAKLGISPSLNYLIRQQIRMSHFIKILMLAEVAWIQ